MQEKIKQRTKNFKIGKWTLDAVIWRVRAEKCLMAVLWGCGAFLLGQAEMLFGTYPLGLALLCASGGYTLPILVGLISASTLQPENSLVYICTYAAAAIIRVAAALLLDPPSDYVGLPASLKRKLRAARAARDEAKGCEPRAEKAPKSKRWEAFGEAWRHIFNESLCLRLATAAVCALIVGLYGAITGGFRYYDLFGAIFMVALTPVAVTVYAISLGRDRRYPVLRHLSQAAILFSIVWSSAYWEVAGFSLSVMLAVYLTLYAVNRRGAVTGCAAAVISGVAYHPLYAPGFLLAALTYSMTRGMKREGGSILISLLAMLTWTIYIGGMESILHFVPAALVAATAFTLTAKLLERWRCEDGEESPEDNTARLRMEGVRHQDANDRFRGISDAFSSLSEMFYNLSDRHRRPGTIDLRRICDSSFDSFCPDCPNKTVCWGLEYSSTLNTVNGLISGLHTKGRVTRAQISPALAHRCDSVDAILEKINRECAKLTGEMLRNNRTEIFAMDYESAANIINDALEEDDGEYRFDPDLEQKVAEYLTDAGVRAHSVTVYGKRRRQVLVRGVDVEHARVTVDTLRSDVGEMCGVRLGAPTFEVEGNVTTMAMQAARKISISGAQNNVAADGGVSGDSVNLFSNKKDYFYALISDGMGAGREAALTSNLCSAFLEKMLRAGNRANTSLRMLNNMMRSRSADSANEYSSTVDLVELDLMTGDAAFIKSGAAPSFIVRGRVVHRVQAGTVPIGILGALDVESTPFHLKEGDTVVMISDGIMQNDPELVWISEYLSGVGTLTPEEIVYHICRHAAECEDHDDCSAVALRVCSAEA